VSSTNDQITEPPLILPGWVLVSRRYPPLPQRASSSLKNMVPSVFTRRGTGTGSPPKYAVEMSLQCRPRAYGIMGGMIMFSDILLTPLLLPVLGIDVDVLVKGTGPSIQCTDGRRHAQVGCSNTIRQRRLKRSFLVFAKRRCRDFPKKPPSKPPGLALSVCAPLHSPLPPTRSKAN
jgi:hypothetical protein